MSSIIEKVYQGNSFSFREDGYFNMTKAAKVFGKRIDHFWENIEAVEYLEALKETILNTRNSGYLKEVELIQTQRGRYGGTWGHPKLAVFFARWLDVKFAVFCDTVISDILSNQATVTFTDKAEAPKIPQSHLETAKQLVTALEEMEKLQEDNNIMSKELNFVTVDEFRALSHMYLSHGDNIRLGRKASKYSKDNDITVEKQERMLHTTGKVVSVNVYAREALEYAAKELGLGE